MSEEDILADRRDFLRGVFGALSTAAVVGGAGAALTGTAQAQTAEVYTPTYFNDAEWRFVNAAVDRLIPPSADGPGGLELQVPRFIDLQMDTEYGHGGFWYLDGPFHPEADFTLGYQLPYSPRAFYRAAVPVIDKWCSDNHGKSFADLDGATQDKVLSGLEKGHIELPAVKSNEFFIQLLANTKEGYFADPMYGGNVGMGSWKMIGFPGARADYKDWVLQYGKVYPLGPVSIMGEKA